MHIDAKHKKDVMARLKSVEGHVRGIERMVEEDVYCVDVIKQTLAVQKALIINALMLENHLNTCVTTALRSEDGNERERVVGDRRRVSGDIEAVTSRLTRNEHGLLPFVQHGPAICRRFGQ